MLATLEKVDTIVVDKSGMVTEGGPVDARMQLPPGYATYLLEEFTEYFYV